MKVIAVLALVSAAGLASFTPQETAGRPGSTAARQEAFFESVKAGEIEKAYEVLLKGSGLEGKNDQVVNLVEATDRGVKLYGGVQGWDNFGIVKPEKHQGFGLGLIRCAQKPIYVYFAWYRPEERAPWAITSVWISDVPKEYWLTPR